MRSHRPVPSLKIPACIAIAAMAAALPAEEPVRPPSVVLIFTDDQGYADTGSFGAQGFHTPHLDRLASEGVRMTHFYAAQAVCSASRTALLTGCYPNRLGILGALGPQARHGIHADETTLAEVCKQKGYATAIFGKWHLGHLPEFLPVQHGFDEYLGLPYSNDMWPHHPTAGGQFPDLPLIDGEKVVLPRLTSDDQRQLTRWYTDRAVQFIERCGDRPFFLYVAHSMPHVPLNASARFQGSSRSGPYGDVIQEIDWSVGEILGALSRRGLERSTLVIFASDNGPWLSYGDHAGSAGPLREGKGTTWEGGVRIPCLMRWPGRIPAGTACAEPAMTIDILPTIAGLIGAPLPSRPIDGKDIWPLISGRPGAGSPHEAYWFYWDRHLQALRSGKWSFHFPHPYRSIERSPRASGGAPVEYSEEKTAMALFDLESDPSQKINLLDRHPEVAGRFLELAEKARAELGDSAAGREGGGARKPGEVPEAGGGDR